MNTTPFRLNLSLVTITLVSLALLVPAGTPAHAAHWTITDLGALGAEHSLIYTSDGLNINHAGQVAGTGVVLTNGVREMHYVVWSNGTQIDLGINTHGLSAVTAAPINDAGQLAGWIQDEGRPFLWQTGVVTRLPNVAGTTAGWVAGINASGTVVGYNQFSWGELVSVRWDGGILTELHVPHNHKVTAINDSGALAISTTSVGERSYVLSGGFTNVVNLPGLDPNNGATMALDLNNAGQVCGWFFADRTVDGSTHAFIWSVGGGTPLPEFPGSASTAVALNIHGHVVGSVNPNSASRAVLWHDGTMTILNDLPEVVAAGWSALTARDINDHDQIVGSGYHNGLLTAFLLSPVAAPSPFSLTITRSGTNVVVGFPTQASFSYDVQSKASLTETNWNLLATIPGDGSTKSFTDPATNGTRFYRVIVP